MTTTASVPSAAADHGDHGRVRAAVGLEEGAGVLVGDAEHGLALTGRPEPSSSDEAEMTVTEVSTGAQPAAPPAAADGST